MTTKTDWDVLLDDLFDKPAPKRGDDDGCGRPECPNCKGKGGRKWPTVNMARWRDRFVTATWSAFRAMQNLGITHVAEDPAGFMDGQAEGASNGQYGIWLRPNATFPVRTATHELAHQVLDHEGLLRKADQTGGAESRELVYRAAEVEAEGTAAIVAHTLGYPDGPRTLQEIREYIWNYVPIDKIGVPPQIRERIKRAAGEILTAGYTAVAKAA